MREDYDSLKEENKGLINNKGSRQQDGSISARSHVSSRTDSDYKSKAKDLESKLKATQQNTKTLGQTLNETQGELEKLIKEHENLSADYHKQLKEFDSLSQINNSNVKFLEDIQRENKKLQTELC